MAKQHTQLHTISILLTVLVHLSTQIPIQTNEFRNYSFNEQLCARQMDNLISHIMLSSASIPTFYSINLVEQAVRTCQGIDRSSIQLATKAYNSSVNSTCLNYITQWLSTYINKTSTTDNFSSFSFTEENSKEVEKYFGTCHSDVKAYYAFQ